MPQRAPLASVRGAGALHPSGMAVLRVHTLRNVTIRLGPEGCDAGEVAAEIAWRIGDGVAAVVVAEVVAPRIGWSATIVARFWASRAAGNPQVRSRDRTRVIADDVDDDVSAAHRVVHIDGAVIPQGDHDQVGNGQVGAPVEIGRYRLTRAVRPGGEIAVRGCAGDRNVGDDRIRWRRVAHRGHTALASHVYRHRLVLAEQVPATPRIENARRREWGEYATDRRWVAPVRKPSANIRKDVD